MHEKVKKNETTFGMANLPAGITGGVAQLKTVTVKKYEATEKEEYKRNQPYVVFRGIAVQPKSHNGQAVAGLGVMITVGLYDVPAKDKRKAYTFDQAYDELLNEFRKFGIPTDNMQFAQLDGVIKHLTDSKPFFRFQTRGWTPEPTVMKPKPTEMVFTEFFGKCDPVTIEKQGSQDHSADAPVEAGSPAAAPSSNGHAQSPISPTGGPVETTTATEPESSADADGALMELAEKADAGDQDAIVTMGEMALNAGLDKDYIENQAANWVEIATAMSSGGVAAPLEDDTTAHVPAVGDKHGYKVINPRTKKPMTDKFGKEKNALQCQITSVDTNTGTVKLKNLANPKEEFVGVKFDELLPPS